MKYEWSDVAACRETTALFYDQAGQRLAIQICDTCPVEEICLWTALLLDDPWQRHGIWGGMLPINRERLAKTLSQKVINERLEQELDWYHMKKFGAWCSQHQMHPKDCWAIHNNIEESKDGETNPTGQAQHRGGSPNLPAAREVPEHPRSLDVGDH
jgi:hypothetical protein